MRLTNQDYQTLQGWLEELIQNDFSIAKLSGNKDDVAAYLDFASKIASLDAMSLGLGSVVTSLFDDLDENSVYGEAYFQSLVLDIMFACETFECGWDGVAGHLHHVMSALKGSQFIPTNVESRIDDELVKDPYVGTAFILRGKMTKLLAREGKRNAS